MIKSIKNKNNKEIEKENGWNNRFNINDNYSKFSYYKIENPTILKPKQLRISSANKSKNSNDSTTFSKIRIKSANKINLITRKNTYNNNDIFYTQPNFDNENFKTEKFLKIKNLWENLGVNKNYQNIFCNISSQLAQIYREGYFDFELNQLNNVNKILQNINKNIQYREEIIISIQKLENDLKNNNNDKENILNEITKNLNNLRLISIEITNNYMSLRKEIGYETYCQKFYINKIVNFNKNYLLQMKNDTDFFNNTELKNYYEFAHESDPFLTNLNIEIENKIKIPIENENLDKIKECQFILLNEMIFNEINKPFYKKENLSNSNRSFISIKSAKRFIYSKNNIDMNRIKTDYENLEKKNKISNNNKELKSIKAANLNKEKIKKKSFRKNNNLMNILTESFSNNDNKTSLKKKFAYEESKSNEKKIVNKSKTNINCEPKNENKILNKNINITKKQNNNSSINADDLLIIDEIINRSILQKKEIDRQMKNHENNILNQNNNNFNNNIENKNENSIEKYLNNNNNNENELNSNKINDEMLLLKENKNDNNENIKISPFKSIKTDFDNNIFDEKNISKEYDNYYFQPFSGEFKNIINIYNNFYNEIPKEQKISFHINESITFYLKGIYPKIILIFNSLKILTGIAIISFDPFNQLSKNLNIYSICSKSMENFPEILINFLKFCTDNYEYDDILLEFYYGIKEGSFYLIKEMENIIKEKAKFKWVNMENDGIDRKIKYHFKNPNNLNNFDIEMNGKFTMSLKIINLINFENLIDENKENINNINEINDFGLLCLYAEMVNQYDYNISNKLNNNFEEFFKNFKKKFSKFKKITNDFVLCNLEKSNEISNFINENMKDLFNLVNKNILNNNNNLIGANLMKIETNFETIIQTSLFNYKYLLITHNNIEVFTNKEINQNFYVLHSTNENLNFLIYEFDESQKNPKISDLLNFSENSPKINVFEEVKLIYNKINQQPEKIMKKIYLPCFSINKNNFYIKPFSLNDFEFTNEEGVQKINNLNQIEQFNFGIENNLLNEKIKFEQNIDEQTDIIIKNNFLITLINSDLLCDFQIPTISAFIVTKNDWIKDE